MNGRRRALVVAIDRYTHPMLRKLAAPTADAAALAAVLGEPDLGDFEVEVLTDASSYEVAGAVEVLLGEAKSSDLVLLHFSCHGIKDDTGELFLAATNTVPNRLVSTAVEAATVSRLIQRSRAQRVVLLLDCCYGGAFERGVVARAGGEVDVAAQFTQQQGLGGGRGRAIITASSAMEYAFEGTTLTDTSGPAPSLFTDALVEGITSGEADRDQDGQVGLDELYDYIHTKVHDRTPNQTPCKWEFGIQGDLYIAHNPRRRIQPAKLPDELSELIAHPAASVRLAAVGDLDQLAGGPNLGLAAGARYALQGLCDDDSRRVSAAATSALERTQLRVTPTQVDWGQAPTGSPSQVQARIDGGPLAEASTLEVTHEDLHARIADSVLTVTTTEKLAPPDGQVRLSGPAGEATLHITGPVADTSEEEDPALSTEPETATLVANDPEEPATDEHEPVHVNKEPAADEHEAVHPEEPATDEVVHGAEEPDEPQPRRLMPVLVTVVVVLLLGGALAAVLLNRSADQAPSATNTDTTPPTSPSGAATTFPPPFQSAALYEFARYLFDAENCYVPDSSEAPLAYTLDSLPAELVKCETENPPYAGVFWCTDSDQEFLADRSIYLKQAVGKKTPVLGPPAGQEKEAAYQVSYIHKDNKGARIFWDSPSLRCAGELQAHHGDNRLQAIKHYWHTGKPS
jgi:hypothetical protein